MRNFRASKITKFSGIWSNCDMESRIVLRTYGQLRIACGIHESTGKQRNFVLVNSPPTTEEEGTNRLFFQARKIIGGIEGPGFLGARLANQLDKSPHSSLDVA
jgi:hypothetical protein